MEMTHYSVEVGVRTCFAPGMAAIVDAVADELERRGCVEHDYSVIVKGPPELRIVGVD